MRIAATLVLMGSLTSAMAGETVMPPDEVVRNTTVMLQKVIAAREAEFRADPTKLYAVMDELVVPKFDVKYIAQLILARNWKKATPEQREQFQVAFKDMLMRTYADALVEHHSSVKAEWQPHQLETDATNTTVESRLIRDGKPPVPIGFAMRLQDGQWKVYDIIIENLSLITNFRSQVSSEIRRNGIDELIKKLANGPGLA